MEQGQERLFRVLGDVGDDLIATAGQKTFARSPWQRWLPVAASLLLVVGLGAVLLPRLTPSKGTAEHLSAPAQTPVVEEAEAPAAELPEDAPAEAPPAPELEESQSKTEDSVSYAVWRMSREQLVFWDTVYYVEALYTDEEAEAAMGELLGTVEQADDVNLLDNQVYMRVASETREDYKERLVPLEIFVETLDGYLYCLTYYHSALPLMEWIEVEYHWENGLYTELMEMLVLPMENSLHATGMELSYFGQCGELDSEQLLHIFLVTLQMERIWGTRTEDLDLYLWEYGDGYLIPPGDVIRQLDHYLDPEQYVFDAASLEVFDPALGGIRLDTLWEDSLSNDGTSLLVEDGGFLLEPENRRFCVTVGRYAEDQLLQTRYYSIRFEDDRMVYESMGTQSDVPEE